MKIEDYLKSLPQEIISGEDVELPTNSLRDIFRFAELSEKDVFYHLGCGTGQGLEIAIKEFNVRKAVGIDTNKEKILQAEKRVDCDLFCQDITESDISDATVILFWFTDEAIIEKMMKKFVSLNNCRIITIWSPLPECLPEKVQFPYIINQTPFKKTTDLQEQLLAIFGVKCVDFVTAWEFAERYTKAISGPESENDRFLTIIQSLVIWINAKNLGVACGDEIPESIKTYIGILRNFFNIEIEHLLKK
ncbi:MAG: class I SAM-dependent methyltransferase [Crenarchaeota archaeon]|nr:MAG: class I SAM-dependent methyltransferase [Thermoproteota archaeon]RDJ33637.1 MAG: class I SAM-dependent methyltransferase [Thermoproteota archaeon]RDJ38141.1 MAG: class I SAM-dependent methyltransferase [Thermoproteota archaeon]RDJ39091.1 MAG: class I SAM-dependent methyltransferase [Thermoproteota archaeon]